MSNLKVGTQYQCTNPNPFPIEMLNAKKTITKFGSGGCSVAYDYVQDNGSTGAGTMTLEHAEKHLVEIK